MKALGLVLVIVGGSFAFAFVLSQAIKVSKQRSGESE